MSKAKIHWMPGVPISYPSGPGTMRTFILSGIVCPAGRNASGDWSGPVKWVTCKTCLRIAAMHRVDTKGTIAKLLKCPDPEAADRPETAPPARDAKDVDHG